MVASATRAETIAERIRQAIRAGAYISGDRLVELTLARQMQVSQNTIRDALRLLEAEGWVVKHTRHGVYVRTFTRAEADELYTLRTALETVALRWVIEVVTKKDVANLRRILQNGRKDALAGDLSTAIEAVMEFHSAIVTISGRPQTIEMLHRLHNQVYLLEMMREMKNPRGLRSHEARLLLHEKLVAFIEAQDSDGAVDLLHYLIQADRDSLLPTLD